MKRFGGVVALAALAAFMLFAPKSNASELCWTTELLKTSAGATVKTFAGAHDSAFYALPDGITWDWQSWPTAAAAAAFRITFVVTGAGVANADTVRYQVIPQGGGLKAYVNLAEQTAAIGNTALTAGGKVFVGVILQDDNAAIQNQSPFPMSGNSVLKVVGDSNGAFNSVQVYLTYPKRCGSR